MGTHVHVFNLSELLPSQDEMVCNWMLGNVFIHTYLSGSISVGERPFVTTFNFSFTLPFLPPYLDHSNGEYPCSR